MRQRSKSHSKMPDWINTIQCLLLLLHTWHFLCFLYSICSQLAPITSRYSALSPPRWGTQSRGLSLPSCQYTVFTLSVSLLHSLQHQGNYEHACHPTVLPAQVPSRFQPSRFLKWAFQSSFGSFLYLATKSSEQFLFTLLSLPACLLPSLSFMPSFYSFKLLL